jgi:hypothetical protein
MSHHRSFLHFLIAALADFLNLGSNSLAGQETAMNRSTGFIPSETGLMGNLSMFVAAIYAKSSVRETHTDDVSLFFDRCIVYPFQLFGGTNPIRDWVVDQFEYVLEILDDFRILFASNLCRCIDSFPCSSLSIWGNNVTGRIPPEIGNLTNLSELLVLCCISEFLLFIDIVANCSTDTLWLFNNGNLTGEFSCPTDIKDCRILCDPFIDGNDEACRNL